jgi:prolyl oligopeptidase
MINLRQLFMALCVVCPTLVHGATATDENLWLEDAQGHRALEWVGRENARTLAVLEQDSRYPALYQQALAIAETRDRIPAPVFLHGEIFNFWRDADHVRGVWRSTSLDSYLTPQPTWRTALDLDAISTGEHANWVWKGFDCLRPVEQQCLISLSDGGEDALTVREFDLSSGRFVAAGFRLPRGKQSATWIDQDRLAVTREWGPGTLTKSGYPFVVKILKRGAPLSQAQEVFRGKNSDVEVDISSLADSEGHRAVIIDRGLTTFETEHYLLTDSGVVRLSVPLKSEILQLIAGKLLLKLNEPWTPPNGYELSAGSLVSIELNSAETDAGHLSASVVYTPGPRESLSEVAATGSQLLLTHYDNVRGRAALYTAQQDGTWRNRPLQVPDDASIGIADADLHSDHAFLDVTGFLTPSTLLFLNGAATSADAVLTQAKQLPPQFDATGMQVDQHEATSSDGTPIPYFVVHPTAMKPDGANPTILYAYGGFQVSLTPAYSGSIGRLWLQQGGVYVLANIRGGGEFGPAWHEAGLKTHRQLIYDDFAAVARDLTARHITSPRRLGIQGGSNGGLLMGVEFTQHPELWNAVDIQVPLLDMLRYEQIAAGASWVGEYGSVSHPDERAFLASISPYNNLRRGVHYPQPFIWTTTKDDRVGPQHARKFAARLASLGVPYYFYEVIEGGHGAGANLKEQAHTKALEMTYFSKQLMGP